MKSHCEIKSNLFHEVPRFRTDLINRLNYGNKELDVVQNENYHPLRHRIAGGKRVSKVLSLNQRLLDPTPCSGRILRHVQWLFSFATRQSPISQSRRKNSCCVYGNHQLRKRCDCHAQHLETSGTDKMLDGGGTSKTACADETRVARHTG